MVNCELERVDQAKKEFDALLHYQKPNGFIGHMNYWIQKKSFIDQMFRKYYHDPHVSAIIQPPFLAHGLQALYRKLGNSVLDQYLPPVAQYFDFLASNRVYHPEENALISIIHPWESGMDNVVAYDKILKLHGPFITLKWMLQLLKILQINDKLGWDFTRIVERNYFAVEDPLMNSVYADGLFILADLFDMNGDSDQSKKYLLRAQQVENDILNKLWDEETSFFYYRIPLQGNW